MKQANFCSAEGEYTDPLKTYDPIVKNDWLRRGRMVRAQDPEPQL